MNYFEEIAKLEKEAWKTSDKYVKLYIQREKTKGKDKDLDLKLDVQRKENNIIHDKLKQLKVSVVEASYLNFEMMGKIFARIVTLFEVESYEFSSLYLNVVSGNEEFYENVYFIAPCTLNKTCLTYDFLLNSKDILILCNDGNRERKRFIDFQLNRKIQGQDYGRFNYLGEFIMYIINCKLNYNVDIENANNIEKLFNEFVELHKNDIEKKREKIEQIKKLILS